ncbi:hypothetical protein ABFS82_11G049600 [Erythranthe guttata]
MGQASLVVAFIMVLAVCVNENAAEFANVGRKHSDLPITFCLSDKDCERMCDFFLHRISCGCLPNKTCCCLPLSPPSNVIR